MKQRRVQNLGDVIAGSNVLSELSARVALMARVQQSLQSHWPALTLTVLSMRDGILTLTAPSNAVSAKARQFEPSILAAAQRINPALQSVRFKAGKPSPAPRLAASTRDRVISCDTLEQLQMTASDMEPGAIRSALERLIRRQLNQN